MVELLYTLFNIENVIGDKVLVHVYEGEVIRISGEVVLVHFGGDSLHFSQEWYNIEDVKLKG